MLIGAAVSNYLIPSLTRQWQTHQKELETKTALIRQISEDVTGIIIVAQLTEGGAATQTQEQYNKALRDWEIERAMIGSQFRAYFPQTKIEADWKSFSDTMSEVYALSETYNSADRIIRLERIGASLPENPVDWKVLENIENRQVGFAEQPQYMDAWFTLKETLLAKQDVIVQEILNSPITALR